MLHSQLTVALATEITWHEDPDALIDRAERVGISSLNEGEEGNRQFIGLPIAEYGAYNEFGTDKFSELTNLINEVPESEDLNRLVEREGLETPEIWTIWSKS